MSDTIMRPAPAPPAAIEALTETVRGRVITAFMSGDDDHRAADNCGANRERLSAVNAVYDPDDSLHVNQNIAPANVS